MADLDEGLHRINDTRSRSKTPERLRPTGVHSGITKVLIINREVVPGRITVVLVDQVLGF